MQQSNAPYPPQDPGQPRRRGLFSGKGAVPSSTPSGDARLEALMAAYQQALAERLEEGLRAIQQTGIKLMHEIAAEVWRTAGGEIGRASCRERV